MYYSNNYIQVLINQAIGYFRYELMYYVSNEVTEIGRMVWRLEGSRIMALMLSTHHLMLLESFSRISWKECDEKMDTMGYRLEEVVFDSSNEWSLSWAPEVVAPDVLWTHVQLTKSNQTRKGVLTPDWRSLPILHHRKPVTWIVGHLTACINETWRHASIYWFHPKL